MKLKTLFKNKIKRIELSFYNKRVYSSDSQGYDFPSLTIFLIGPEFNKGVKQDSFGDDPYYYISTKIPMSIDFVKSDLHWSFSIAFILGIRISYQWGY